MIKKSLVFLFFGIFMLKVFSQSEPIKISEFEYTAGTNFISNNSINATTRIFPDNISGFYVDTVHHLLTVQIRGYFAETYLKENGKIIQYDLSAHTVQWSKNINYGSYHLLQANDVLLMCGYRNTMRLNPETGKKLWKINRNIIYLNETTGTALAYNGNNVSASMQGINVSNGLLKWFRPVNMQFGYNNIQQLNDSVILFSAGGLHMINMQNGFGWDYNAVTGSKDYTTFFAANAAGLILGVLTGYYTYYTGVDYAYEICSGVWIDSSGYYYASKDNIARLSPSGEPIWTSELPKKKTSKSDIFIQNDRVYLVNSGYGMLGEGHVSVGNPFIVAFNKENGNQLFLQQLTEKRDQILDFLVGNNLIICLYNDKVAAYKTEDGQLDSERETDRKALGNLMNFANDRFYVGIDSVYIPLEQADPDNFHVLTDSMNVLTMNNLFEVTGKIKSKELYELCLTVNGLDFLWKGGKMIVINQEKREIAEFNASLNCMLIGNKLYDIQKNKINEIDLTELFRGKNY